MAFNLSDICFNTSAELQDSLQDLVQRLQVVLNELSDYVEREMSPSIDVMVNVEDGDEVLNVSPFTSPKVQPGITQGAVSGRNPLNANIPGCGFVKLLRMPRNNLKHIRDNDIIKPIVQNARNHPDGDDKQGLFNDAAAVLGDLLIGNPLEDLEDHDSVPVLNISATSIDAGKYVLVSGDSMGNWWVVVEEC